MKKNCKKNSPIITLGNGTQFKEYLVRNGKKLWCGIQREITKEIAEEMNRSTPAVAGLLHRGLKNLREVMEKK